MKIKTKNKLLVLFLTLVMVLGMIPFVSAPDVVEASAIDVSHTKGNYKITTSNDYENVLILTVTQEALLDLKNIYGTNATFLTPVGDYIPQGASMTAEGKVALCANPTVLAGTDYTDKITISAMEVNKDNANQFFGTYTNYRYPMNYLKQKVINYYGSEATLIEHAAISFLSGIIQQSGVSNEVTQELIDIWKEERPGEDIANAINVEQLKAPLNAFFFSWYYSFDAEIVRATGGRVSVYSSAEIVQSYLNFYSFVYNQIKEGKLVLENTNIGIYYVPEIQNDVGVHSNAQVVHAFSGDINLNLVGDLKLVKSSADTMITNGNNCYNLAGTEFTVYEDQTLTKEVGKLTVSADGTSNVLEDLTAGIYYAKETKAGKGYFLDRKTYTVEVKPSETAELKVANRPMDDPVTILLQKQDATTGKPVGQGDASLALAEFTVKYYGGDYAEGVDPATQGVSPTRTWVLRTDSLGEATFANADQSFIYNGQSYPYKVSGDDFYLSPLGEPTFPLGTVTIQETKAPEGYFINEEIHVRKIKQATQGTELLDLVEAYNVPIVPENVALGDFTLRKVITDGQESEVTRPEADAKFVAISRKYVEQYGSFEEALAHVSEYGINEWSELVTDENGNAKSGKLAFGEYFVKQTEGEIETDLLKAPFVFEVKQDGDTAEYTINNVSAEYYARLVKKDAVTGENVILHSASFKIKNLDTDEYVSMKIGSKRYDTFKTTSENAEGIPAGTFYVDTEELGTAVTPLTLKAGRYQIEEVETPLGYYFLPEPIEFEVGLDAVTETDEDLDEIIDVVIENQPQYGELTLHKQGEIFNGWVEEQVTLPVQNNGETVEKEVIIPRANEALTLTRTWLEVVEYEELVVTEEEITDPETGEVTIVETEEIVQKTREEERSEAETVYTDETGLFSREVGEGTWTITDKTEAVLATVTVAEGATDTITVQLPDDVRIDEEYVEGDVINQTFTYNKATYKDGYLAGAEFELVAQEDLKSYDGQTTFYLKDEKLLFAQQDIVVTGETVYKKGEVITFPKLDDAIMQNKDFVDSKVVTEANATVISRIPLGKYKLVEAKAPTGYIKDETVRDFEFTPQEKTILVDMKETEMIENVRQKLNVFLAKSLLSTEYFEETGFENIVIGMYTREEILGLPADSLVAVVAPDQNGAMSVNDVPQGNYYFKEISTKDGYVLNEAEYSISVEADEVATEDKVEVLPEPIVNEPSTKDIKIVKVDKDTDRALVGVEFNLFKLEAGGAKTPILNQDTGDYIFTTDENGEILIKGLPHGTYSLEEIKAHDGYIKEDESKTISVADDSKLEIRVENEVTTIGFRKIDAKTGLPVVGATLRLVDAEGNPVYLDDLGYVTEDTENGVIAEWVTDGELFYVKGLSIDHGYTVIEIKAPEGYHKAENLGFRVTGNKGVQLTAIPNMPYEPEIKTKAFNADTGEQDTHATEKVKICDTITYKDLIPGREHKAKAKLVLASDPTVVVATADLVFTPTEKDGEVTVCFGEVDLREFAGTKLVVFENVFDLTTNLKVASHEEPTDEDQTITVKEVEVGTTATFENGKKNGHAIKEIVVVDKVAYKGLIVGETYTIKGQLVDKADPENVITTAEKTFVAETADGFVEMSFVFDATDLKGKELVVFEELYYKAELIGKHKDPNDPGQTVKIEEPEIGTQARSDGKNVVGESKETVIVDTVKYTNLIVGETYTVKGILMDKSTGKPILVNGQEVTAETTFVAETADGFVEVVFKFDSTGLGGKDLVVFEELYYKGELIAEHKDINDKEQTVKIEKLAKPLTNDDSVDPKAYLLGGSITMLLALIVAGKLLASKKNKEETE